jgi:hypothetical protein
MAKYARITTAIIDKPIKYVIICSNRDDRPVRFQRIKEAEITTDNRDGAPKNQKCLSNTASKGETHHVKLRNIEAIPDSPAMVRNHCIGERFISSSIKTRKLSKVTLQYIGAVAPVSFSKISKHHICLGYCSLFEQM